MLILSHAYDKIKMFNFACGRGEEMRDKFWKLYEEVIRSERYYWHYQQRAIRIDRGIKIFLAAASLSSVAGLWLWGAFPHIWAIIAAFAQVISACSYLLPYSARITATKNLLPELQHILNCVGRDWDRLIDLSDDEINDLVFHYQEQMAQLENRYASGGLFPVCSAVEKKAESDSRKYKFSHLDVSQTNYLEEALRDNEG